MSKISFALKDKKIEEMKLDILHISLSFYIQLKSQLTLKNRCKLALYLYNKA